MPPTDSQSSGFSTGRRWFTTLNLLLATGAALALVVMMNYLASGHYKRFPWADATRFELYPQTLRVLNSLTNDVQVTIFYQHRADIYTMICALLGEYQQANPSHVHVQDLDYVKYPGEAAKLLARLHLEPTKKDFVAFETRATAGTRFARTPGCRITISTICCWARKSAARPSWASFISRPP